MDGSTFNSKEPVKMNQAVPLPSAADLAALQQLVHACQQVPALGWLDFLRWVIASASWRRVLMSHFIGMVAALLACMFLHLPVPPMLVLALAFWGKYGFMAWQAYRRSIALGYLPQAMLTQNRSWIRGCLVVIRRHLRGLAEAKQIETQLHLPLYEAYLLWLEQGWMPAKLYLEQLETGRHLSPAQKKCWLAAMHLVNGDGAGALPLWAQAQALEPDNPFILFDWAATEAQCGDVTQAKRLLAQVDAAAFTDGLSSTWWSAQAWITRAESPALALTEAHKAFSLALSSFAQTAAQPPLSLLVTAINGTGLYAWLLHESGHTEPAQTLAQTVWPLLQHSAGPVAQFWRQQPPLVA